MGNKPVTLGLRTDQPRYTAGDYVTGSVYLFIKGEPQPLESLHFQIVGEESTTVHQTSTNDPYYQGAHAIFVNLEQNVPTSKDENGCIPPGQYEFPFRILLPPTMPSSISCKAGQSIAHVRYYLLATFRRPGFNLTNPQAKRTLYILDSPPKNLDIGKHIAPMDFLLNSCYGMGLLGRNKGSMSLEMKVERRMAQPDDFIDCSFRCKNESIVGVKQVIVEIKEIVEWTANGYRKSTQEVLDSKTFESNSFPELSSSFRFRGKEKDQELDWCPVQLKIPHESYDSNPGHKLIQVQHLLSVKIIPRGFCIAPPAISTRLRLYRHLNEPAKNPERTISTGDHERMAVLPPHWEAEVSDPVEISMKGVRTNIRRTSLTVLEKLSVRSVRSVEGEL